MFQTRGWFILVRAGSVSAEPLAVKCLYNLEPHCQDVNGLGDYIGSLVYIRPLLVRSIQWLEWNKINPEIERTPSLLSWRGPPTLRCKRSPCTWKRLGHKLHAAAWLILSAVWSQMLLAAKIGMENEGKKEHTVTFSVKLSHEISSEAPPRADPNFLPHSTPLLSELSRVILFLTRRVLQLWEIIAVTHILRAKSTVKRFNSLQLEPWQLYSLPLIHLFSSQLQFMRQFAALRPRGWLRAPI